MVSPSPPPLKVTPLAWFTSPNAGLGSLGWARWGWFKGWFWDVSGLAVVTWRYEGEGFPPLGIAQRGGSIIIIIIINAISNYL